MSHIFDRKTLSEMPVRQNRIAEIVFIGAEDIAATADCHRVIGTGSALRMHDVVILPDFIEMRPLRPMYPLHRAVPDIMFLTDELHLSDIQLPDPDIPVAVILAAVRIRMRTDIITFSVFIKEQTRVNASCLRQIMRVRPRPRRVLCCHNEIPAPRNIRTDDIVGSFMITYRGCKKSLGMTGSHQRQLFLSIQHISDLFPMDEITAVKDRQSRKIGKCGVHQIIISPHRTDGRVRVKARHNRVLSNRCHFILLLFSCKDIKCRLRFIFIIKQQGALRQIAAASASYIRTVLEP